MKGYIKTMRSLIGKKPLLLVGASVLVILPVLNLRPCGLVSLFPLCLPRGGSR